MTTEPSSSADLDLDLYKAANRALTAVAKDALAEVSRLQTDLVEMTRSYDEVAANLEHTRQIVAAQGLLAKAVRKYLFEDGYDSDPQFERHDTGCATYDAYQHGPCDCGSEALLNALLAYEARLDAADKS